MNKRVRQSFSVLLLIVAAAHLAGTAMGGEPEPGKGKAAGGEARFETFTAEQKEHWAYQPLERPQAPSVRQAQVGQEPDRPVHPGRAGNCRDSRMRRRPIGSL